MADNNKQRNGFRSYLPWLVLMSIALISTARGEDRALLIGVGRYVHFDNKLRGIDLDLDMMSETAQLMGFPKSGIKVLKHEQATAAAVHQTFENWLMRGLQPEDRVLIYFSGHGSQVPDENNDEPDQLDEVLLLYDTLPTVRNTHPTLNGVLHDDRFGKMLARIKSRNILVILDACHSGSATRGLSLMPHSIPVKDAQVKYLYYSPLPPAAGSGGKFDLMVPESVAGKPARYVAITACRDNEKTVATSQGSIFTLALRQAVRSAAMADKTITPMEIQRQTTRFIKEQIQADVIRFHPQISGHKELRERPLKLVALSGGNGIIRHNLASLVEKSHGTIRIKPNKTCFEPGDVLELSIEIDEPGYLNVMSVAADDRSVVLFPNLYNVQNSVLPGKITIPTPQMEFELICEGPAGPHLITAFLTQSPLNSYKNGFKAKSDVLADLSPVSTRSLRLRQKKEWPAAGRVSVEFRNEGQCQ
ncbi:MAG: DUF4384 domain-containing protein [bacterium]|nr:DUF4384 domain-containing protein [bacterium]